MPRIAYNTSAGVFRRLLYDQSRTCICKLKQGKASKAKSEGRQ